MSAADRETRQNGEVQRLNQILTGRRSTIVQYLAESALNVVLYPDEVLEIRRHLEAFIAKLASASGTQDLDLLLCTVYMQRLRFILPKNAEGVSSTPYRIFMASLIVYLKYYYDVSPKNLKWAKWSNMENRGSFSFTLEQVNSMERNLLRQLDYDLRMTEKDVSSRLEAFSTYERFAELTSESNVGHKLPRHESAWEQRKGWHNPHPWQVAQSEGI